MTETKIKVDIDKEKLYLIRQILVDADKNGLELPDDVISLLQQESKLLLEKIVGWENINKQETLKLTFHAKSTQEVLNFVFSTKLAPEVKLLILEQLENYKNSDFFDDYLNLIKTFSALDPTKEEVEKIISNIKIDFSKDISRFISKAKEKFSSSDILKILNPVLENREWKPTNMSIISAHISDFYEYQSKELIYDDDLLTYLSYGIEECEILELLLSNYFKSLLARRTYLTQDEIRKIMTWIKEEKELSHSISKLFASNNFLSLLLTGNFTISKVISFIEDKLKEKDFNSIIILSNVLENIPEQVIDNKETVIIDHFALAEKISAIYKKETKGIYTPPQKLYSYLEYDGNIYEFLSFVSYFSRLEREEQIDIILLLGNISDRQNISAIHSLSLQFMRLDSNIKYVFLELLSGSLSQKVNGDEGYYSVLSYLLSQLPISSTQEDKEKLQTVKEILIRDPKLITTEKWESIFENKKNICQIIDLVFSTTESYQRKNMIKLTKKEFRTCEDYLNKLHDAATSVKEEEYQELYLRYKDKIEKVDQLLGKQKKKIKKIDTVDK